MRGPPRADRAGERPDRAPVRLPARRTPGRAGGILVPAEISLSAIDTDDGLLVIAAVRDVTEWLESRGQLAGGVARDFNNLLGVISDYAAFVGDEVAKDGVQVDWQSVREDVRQIQLAARRAADLILLPAGGNPQDPVPLRLHRHRRRHRPRGHRDRREPYRGHRRAADRCRHAADARQGSRGADPRAPARRDGAVHVWLRPGSPGLPRGWWKPASTSSRNRSAKQNCSPR
jgi:hypothetical protein